jgi:hypothetical protein
MITSKFIFFQNFTSNEKTLKCRYSPYHWMFFSRTVKRIPRTANYIESWHNRLNTMCIISHPNIAFFITKLFEVEEVDRKELYR